MRSKVKTVIAIVLILAIAAATVVPIVTQWGGLFYEKAGRECTEVAQASQRIFNMSKYGIDESYRDRFIQQFKK